jgi:hypothetical protein
VPASPLATTLVAVAAVGWLAFLVAGRTRGSTKRALFRLTLLGIAAALVQLGRGTGLFAQAGGAGRVVLVLVTLLLAISYLYLVRFCPSCGRMHRNFRLATCQRCESPLPDHGLTIRPRRVRTLRPPAAPAGIKPR